MRQFIACAKMALRYRDYKPQAVTIKQAQKWLQQFEKRDRRAIIEILGHVVYFSETQTRKTLVHQNDVLLARLRESGLRLPNVIYIQVHDAGSSSPAMLNMLRDAARLEPLGCKFMDSRDSMGLHRVTNTLGEGALIYVDDFLGTGDQFSDERLNMMASVVGNFSEFLLVPCICEEAYYRLAKAGVEVFTGLVHARAQRPLHDNSAILDKGERERLRNLCLQIDRKSAMGYKELASMVVLYRNSPDNIPVVFRGSVGQKPFAGIFPRIQDLPKRVVK